jgi:hypothetical protein
MTDDIEAITRGLETILDGHARRRANERQAKIDALPRDAHAEVLKMGPEDQDAYLQSLDRVAGMAERGEDFVPAPYGRRKDGTPRKKSGRRPVRAVHPDYEPPPPKAQADEDAQEDFSWSPPEPPPPPPPVWTATGKQANPPADPDDPFSVGSIVDVELRLYDDPTGYRMTMTIADGIEETIWQGHDPTGFGVALAMKRIKVDKDTDHSPLHQLAKVHPAEARRRERHAARIAALPMGGSSGGRGRQIYRDQDVTGQPSTFSDGVNTWS